MPSPIYIDTQCSLYTDLDIKGSNHDDSSSNSCVLSSEVDSQNLEQPLTVQSLTVLLEDGIAKLKQAHQDMIKELGLQHDLDMRAVYRGIQRLQQEFGLDDENELLEARYQQLLGDRVEMTVSENKQALATQAAEFERQLLEEHKAHQAELSKLRAQHEQMLSKRLDRAVSESNQALINQAKALKAKFEAQHHIVLQTARREVQKAHKATVNQLKAQHRIAIKEVSRQQKQSRQTAITELEAQHGLAVDRARREERQAAQVAKEALQDKLDNVVAQYELYNMQAEEQRQRQAAQNAKLPEPRKTESVPLPQLELQPQPQLMASSKTFEGISLQVLGAFIEVIGVALVSLAVAALAFGSISVSMPVCAAIAGGVLLATAGLFAYDKGCELKQPHIEENIAIAPNL